MVMTGQHNYICINAIGRDTFLPCIAWTATDIADLDWDGQRRYGAVFLM